MKGKKRRRVCALFLCFTLLAALLPGRALARTYYCQPIVGYCSGCGKPQFPLKNPPDNGKYTCYPCRAARFEYVTVPQYPFCKICKAQQHCGNIWDMCDYCIMNGDYSGWEAGRLTEANKQEIRDHKRPSSIDWDRACKDPAYAWQLAKDLLGMTGAAAAGAAAGLAEEGQKAVNAALEDLLENFEHPPLRQPADYEEGVKQAQDFLSVAEDLPGSDKGVSLAQKGIAAADTANALNTALSTAEWEEHRGSNQRNPMITETVSDSLTAAGSWAGNREAGKWLGESSADLLLGWSNVLLGTKSDQYFTETGREFGVDVNKLDP